jgi:hypothetical protein
MAQDPTVFSIAPSVLGRTPNSTPYPDPPVPANWNDRPPKISPRTVVGTTTEKLAYWWDYDHGSTRFFIPGPPAPQPIANQGGQTNYFYGPFPDYTLTYRIYWQQLDLQRLGPGAVYSYSDSVTVGMSSTTKESLSAELGVAGGGLSAKLSATFEQSITISTEKTILRQWSEPGIPDKNTVWILWQLVEEVVGLNNSDGTIVGGWPYGTCGCNLTLMPILGGWNGDTSIPTPQALQPVHEYSLIPTSFPVA